MRKTIVITGASSGIGAELAKLYAYQDYRLVLIGRNDARLEEVAKHCRAKTSEVLPFIIDVTDYQAMKNIMQSIEEEYGIDIIIANAGVSAGTLGGTESYEQTKQILDINIYGVVNTILPIMDSFIKKRSGKIAIISSIAGLVGLSSSPAYSTSKAAVLTYAESLRNLLSKHGVSVSLVIPGFVKSPMTDKNQYNMPFLMPTEKAADIIINGIKKGKRQIIFPMRSYLAVMCFKMLPVIIRDFINSRLPGKSSF